MASYYPTRPHERLNILEAIASAMREGVRRADSWIFGDDEIIKVDTETIASDLLWGLDDRQRFEKNTYTIVDEGDELELIRRPTEAELERLSALFIESLEREQVAEILDAADIRKRLAAGADHSTLARRIHTDSEVETWVGDELVDVEPLPHHAA